MSGTINLVGPLESPGAPKLAAPAINTAVNTALATKVAALDGELTDPTIVGGTIAGASISGGTISSASITGGTISGTSVSGGTISGTSISGGAGAFTTLTASTSYRLLIASDTSWSAFGPAAAVVATEGNQNCILGYVHNALPADSPNLGSAINGYGRLESAGSAVFGVYGLSELRVARGTAVAAEFTARNYGAAPDTGLPPNEGIGTPNAVSNALQITSGGTFASSLGMVIGKEGGSTVNFNTAAYIKDFDQYGLFIGSQASGTQTPVVIQNNGNGVALQLQTTGAAAPNNSVIAVYDSGSVGKFSVRQSGDIYGTVLNVTGYIQSANNCAGAYPATSQNVAIGWNFTGSAAEADWWNANNAGGGHVFYQRTGTSTSTRLMDISAAGNVKAYGELSTAGYVLSSTNSAGVYPTTGQNVAIGWNFASGAAEADWWNANNAGGGHIFWQRTGTSTSTRLMDISAAGNVKAYGGLTITGALTLAAPVTVTGTTYTVLATDTTLILNPSAGQTLTLGTATAGRVLYLKLIAAFAVISASSNVVPQAGGAAGTAILTGTAGKWATLQGDGTNWQILQSN